MGAVQHSAVTARADITVLMGKQKSYPVRFSGRRKSYPVQCEHSLKSSPNVYGRYKECQ